MYTITINIWTFCPTFLGLYPRTLFAVHRSPIFSNGVTTEIEIRREVKDEDILWAEDEPDDDDIKNWKMKVIMNPEDDY